MNESAMIYENACEWTHMWNCGRNLYLFLS